MTWRQVQNLGAIATISIVAGTVSAQPKNVPFKPAIPKTWDEKALADWATPVAGLNVRPGHFSEEEYYRTPIHNYRTYPVYYPGREPAGYWDMLQKVGPQPLIEPGKLKTEADWIEAGRQVFEQADVITVRRYDPKIVAAFHSLQEHQKAGSRPTPNGTLGNVRWVPTSEGLAISLTNCAPCHTRYEKDGRRINGPPPIAPGSLGSLGRLLFGGDHVAAAPIRIPGDAGMRRYRAFGVPWVKDDIHERLKLTASEGGGNDLGVTNGNGVFARWNGSRYYPARIPDLIGIKDRKYLDHTASHLNRGVEDLMRYAALVGYAESSDFGPYHMLTAEQRKIEGRLPDEALYALALYIQSLKPPPNPNTPGADSAAGKKIFERERCTTCHTPGLYTNNKLTLALGFEPPPDRPSTLDILPLSVGTDPSLALKTRKGTGYYKVPSLKNIWYRHRLLHDGSIASLEEMFDPERLKDTHVPGGSRPAGVETRAVIGHEFGLKLTPEEKKSLLVFLRTL